MGLKEHVKRRRFVLGICVVIAGIAVTVSIFAIYPMVWRMSQTEQGLVAATLDDGTVIYEDDVTNYIENYRKKVESSGSGDWSSIMKQYDFSAETLRKMTIYELAAKDIMAGVAHKSNISISDKDVSKALKAEKESLGIQSDTSWESMLGLYDTDEDSVKESMRYRLLENAVYEKYVAIPNVTDTQTLSYMKNEFAGTTAHLVQVISGSDTVELGKLEDQIKESKCTVAKFADYVARYSDDTVADDKDGVLGWDIQYGTSSDIYEDMKDLKAGNLFDDFYPLGGTEKALLFCAETYRIPENPNSLSRVPKTLVNYFRIQTRKQAWQSDCKSWLQKRIEDSIHINAMPGGLSYE